MAFGYLNPLFIPWNRLNSGFLKFSPQIFVVLLWLAEWRLDHILEPYIKSDISRLSLTVNHGFVGTVMLLSSHEKGLHASSCTYRSPRYISYLCTYSMCCQDLTESFAEVTFPLHSAG